MLSISAKKLNEKSMAEIIKSAPRNESIDFLKIYFIAFTILFLLCIQLVAMSKMLRDPKKLVPWYNGTGVLLYVIGMMVSATGLGYF